LFAPLMISYLGPHPWFEQIWILIPYRFFLPNWVKIKQLFWRSSRRKSWRMTAR